MKHPQARDERRILMRKYDRLAKYINHSRHLGNTNPPKWYRLRHQRALCSCYMCGNPRRHLGIVSYQELKSNAKLDAIRRYK